MAVLQQQEWMIYNQRGELMRTIMAPAGYTQAQVAYNAGVPQEWVDPVKNAAHQPASKAKP